MRKIRLGLSNSAGFTVFELVLIIAIVFLLGFTGWAYFSNVSDTHEITESKSNNEPTASADSLVDRKSTNFTSDLYPGLTFEVPDGWRAEEPESYSDDGGPPSTASEIKVSDGSAVLKLVFYTERATGFESQPCHTKSGLEKVADLYRYREQGVYEYRHGYAEGDDKFEQILDEGGYDYEGEGEPNYCRGNAIIRKYESTLDRDEYSEIGLAFPVEGSNKVIAWLMEIELSGSNLNREQVEKADDIVASLSEGVR